MLENGNYIFSENNYIKSSSNYNKVIDKDIFEIIYNENSNDSYTFKDYKGNFITSVFEDGKYIPKTCSNINDVNCKFIIESSYNSNSEKEEFIPVERYSMYDNSEIEKEIRNRRREERIKIIGKKKWSEINKEICNFGKYCEDENCSMIHQIDGQQYVKYIFYINN